VAYSGKFASDAGMFLKMSSVEWKRRKLFGVSSSKRKKMFIAIMKEGGGENYEF